MGRLSEEAVERLKHEVSVRDLVRDSGVTLTRKGHNWMGCCPFHEDRSPSLGVSHEKNLWHCFSCRCGGSAVDWVMKAENLSFRDAVQFLIHRYAPSLAHSIEAVKADFVARDSSPEAAVEAGVGIGSEAEVLAQVVAHYQGCLLGSVAARDYLASRGFVDAALISRFSLGYCDRSLGASLPKDRLANAAAKRRLRELGILRENGHEHFHGCLVVPIFGASGEVVQLYGRRIHEEHADRRDAPRHLYLPGPQRGVWNLEGVQDAEEILVCEALLDALTLWQHGFTNVTSLYGAKGWGLDHNLFFGSKWKGKRVLLAFDGDEAGDEGALSIARTLGYREIACGRVALPRGLDVNAFALSVDRPAERLGELVDAARLLAGGESKPLLLSSAAKAAEGEVLEVSAPLVEAESKPPVVRDEVLVSALPEPEVAEPELKAAAVAPPLVPASFPDRVQVLSDGEEMQLAVEDRRYRVRGFGKNQTLDELKIHLTLYAGEGFHSDYLNLQSGHQRRSFAKAAVLETQLREALLMRDLGAILFRLESLLGEKLAKSLEAKEPPKMSAAEEAEALELLRDPGLTRRLLADFETCGVIGEETNKLLGYLVTISRKLEKPLGMIIQSSSSAGKTSLMESILALVPEEDKVKYSAITGQALYYFGETDLCWKVLAVVEEAGAEKATYPLKLLISEGEVSIASTGKNESSGRHNTIRYTVRGPVAVIVTTTSIETDEEFQNRCLVVSVDESREQTQAIHRQQRLGQVIDGLKARVERSRLIRLHQNAQRLLKPLLVVNPFADRLTFMDDRTRSRRDHAKYLQLIQAVTLLYQHQRPVRTLVHRGKELAYIETAVQDIEIANGLAHTLLGQTLDELPQQTLRVMLALHERVSLCCQQEGVDRSDFRFRRRQVRDWLSLGMTQVTIHLDRLVKMEYAIQHKGRRGQTVEYELLYNGEGLDMRPFMLGLIDVEELKKSGEREHVRNLSGEKEGFSGSYRGHSGLKTGLDGEITPLNHGTYMKTAKKCETRISKNASART